MKFKKRYLIISFVAILSILILNAYRPVRNILSQPTPWKGQAVLPAQAFHHDSTRKNVFIVADNQLTEMFDMLTPFYLFNATGKANVYIIAKTNLPIPLKSDLYVCPQITFKEADSLGMKADVIVIPALSARDEHQDPLIIAWIKNHFTPETRLLSICDGASTGAATGLYDGKPITCHASDISEISSHFSKPVWIRNVCVAKSGNLFSTGGVSNAAEGCLTVISEVFGKETTMSLMSDISYPHQEIQGKHESIAIRTIDWFNAIKKVMIRKNKDIALLLGEGINEFTLASILDTYSRSLPASFKTYFLNDSVIRSRFGLSFISRETGLPANLDELHVLVPGTISPANDLLLKNIKTIRYWAPRKEYPVNACLKNIGQDYGRSFERFVSISLDYN